MSDNRDSLALPYRPDVHSGRWNSGFSRPKQRKKVPRNKLGTESNPIRSYGVILVYVPEGVRVKGTPETEFIKKCQIMVCERRDSIAYTVLIKGYYKPDTIPSLVSRLTKSERERMLQQDFRTLWNDVWVNHRCKKYRDDYSRAFLLWINNRDKIHLHITASPCHIPRAVYGFSKGRKHPRETYVSAALREFEEETRLPRNMITLITSDAFNPRVDEHGGRYFPRMNGVQVQTHRDDTDPPRLIEKIQGTDSEYYEYIYYIGYTDDPTQPQPIYIDNPIPGRQVTVSDEFKTVNWLTLDSSFEYLDATRYDLARKAILAMHQYFQR